MPSQTDHRGSQVVLLPVAMPVGHHQLFSAGAPEEPIEEVLKRLEEDGMHLKQEKCAFLMPEGDYLEHKICQEGLQPTESKVSDVADSPEPKRVAELRSFLGLVNYYGKFLAT